MRGLNLAGVRGGFRGRRTLQGRGLELQRREERLSK